MFRLPSLDAAVGSFEDSESIVLCAFRVDDVHGVMTRTFVAIGFATFLCNSLFVLATCGQVHSNLQD